MDLVLTLYFAQVVFQSLHQYPRDAAPTLFNYVNLAGFFISTDLLRK